MKCYTKIFSHTPQNVRKISNQKTIKAFKFPKIGGKPRLNVENLSKQFICTPQNIDQILIILQVFLDWKKKVT